jgi:hypothetical protein
MADPSPLLERGVQKNSPFSLAFLGTARNRIESWGCRQIRLVQKPYRFVVIFGRRLR